MKTQQEYLADFNKSIAPFFEENNPTGMLKSLREEILKETNRLSNEAKIIEIRNKEIKSLIGDMVTELRELLAKEFPELTMSPRNRANCFYVEGPRDMKFCIELNTKKTEIDWEMKIEELSIGKWTLGSSTIHDSKEELLSSDLFKDKIVKMYKEIARVNLIHKP
tara:strand:+ start:110 stop:604 length:495 start_codon:yes stop_codon:yes gene_type:complete